MKNKGSALLIVALAVVILAMVGFALVRVRPSTGSGATRNSFPRATFAVLLSRTPSGISAVVTVTNTGSDNLQNLRITRADVPGMTGASSLPLVIGDLARGVRAIPTLPFTGPAPAPN